MKKRILALTLASLALVMPAQTTPAYKFSKKISLPGDGKWDYMSVDNNRNRLYVSHGDRVHVVELITDQVIAEWTGLDNVHGIAFNGSGNKVYVANTGLNTLVVYDATTLEKTTVIELPGGKKPDCVLFDAFTQKVFVFCGKSENAFVIDANTDKVLTKIALEGKPEFACTDNKGLIYNNLEDKNEVLAIDAKTNQVLHRFSLEDGKAPTGIAIDNKNGRLYVTCEESQKLFVLSTNGGKVIGKAPIGEKTDGVIYEENLHFVITSNGGGSATVIKQETPDKYDVLQTLKTQPGLKTISYQERTHRFFTTGADFQADGKTPVPGSFGVFVYTLK